MHRRRWYVNLGLAVVGAAIIVLGVPIAHECGWPSHAQVVVALVSGLVFSTNFVRLGANTLAAAIRDVLTAIMGFVRIAKARTAARKLMSILQRAGAAVGLSWCAAAVATWFPECGAQTPAVGAASTGAWMGWAKTRGL